MNSVAESVPTGARPAFNLKPLMFESFVCSMVMMAFVSLAGPIARVIGLAPWQVGIAVTAAGLAWALMARFWGALSDRRGRRPIILFGLTGFAVSYCFLSLFIDFALRTAMTPALAFVGLFVGRGIAGVFYSAVPATSAALVADHVDPEARTAAMAAIGASGATGMIVGPGFAGLIGSISLSLPLYVTALLPTVALAVLCSALPRTKHYSSSKTDPIRLSDPRLRRPMSVVFVAAFSIAVAQMTVGFFALDRLHLDPTAAARVAGLALAIAGLALICAQLILRKLDWPPDRLIRFGSSAAAVGFASAMLATSPLMLWASYAFAAFGMGWVYPSVAALAANSFEGHEQGAAAGSLATAEGLGVIAGPIAGGAFYALDSGLPYAVIAGMMLISVACRGSEHQAS